MFRSLGLGAAAVLVIATPVAAQTTVQLQIGSSEIVVNGAVQPADMHGFEPIIVDGRAIVPLRPVIEALGGTVSWSSDLRLITVRDSIGENEVILKINSRDSVVNARTGPRLDVPPILIDGVTKVPISFVSAHLGFDIEWDEEARTITIINQ